MVTEIDHVNALRARLIDRQREKERELAEIQEMIRVLGDAPKVLAGKTTSRIEHQEASSVKQGTPINKDLAKTVLDWLITQQPADEIINRQKMIADLKANHGVTGKDKSLYAYISSLMAKWAKDKNNPARLRQKAGVGFYKERIGDSDRKDSELVASV